MSVVVRPAVADDAPACAAVINAWIDGTDWMPRLVAADVIEDALRKGFPIREAYVVGEPPMGYLSLDPAESHIWGFYVGTPGQGLGKALLDRAKQARGYLRLNSHAANLRAHAFYRREGFVQVGEAWDGEDGIPEITMEWRRDG